MEKFKKKKGYLGESSLAPLKKINKKINKKET